MNQYSKTFFAISLPALALASCAAANSGESSTDAAETETGEVSYTITEMGKFDEPWAIEFAPGTDMLFISEKAGKMEFVETGADNGEGRIGSVTGLPEVAYGGQGGLGDIAFLQSEASGKLDGRTIYLSWVEAGDSDTRGAVVGRGSLTCVDDGDCAIEGLNVIWRQSPKVEGRGHFSHRITFSPDEKYMFVASGDRQKQTPAQDTSSTLGSIVRLNLDGTPAAGNPMADKGGVTAQIWSYGHRNILGMDWDAQGHLWEVEHGPAGGDELNVVKKGANYGWPTRSYGENYNGDPIPDHTADDGFAKPAEYWTPVIAPGDMIIYKGDMFAPWKGNALIAGLSTQSLIRVALDGESASEAARYEFDNRLRSIEEGPDGSIWIAEDGSEAKVMKLSM